MDGQTSYRWNDLDATNANGSTYNYAVRERAIANYHSRLTGSGQGGFVIENIYVSPHTPPRTPPNTPPSPQIPSEPNVPQEWHPGQDRLPETGELRSGWMILSLVLIGVASLYLLTPSFKKNH